jgi:hypothetical protein
VRSSRQDGDDPEDKDNHQFFVPRRARWSEIQKIATDLGSALNKACSQLEEANGSLEGVLAGIDYNDERKLGDARNRDVVLGRLVQHFTKLYLLDSITFAVKARSHGGLGMLHMTKAGMEAWPVVLPSVPEQKKIAAILSSVDQAIEATQAMIEQLQVVKKAMMAELFTRGLPGRHTRFKRTEIGEVPEEWRVSSLGQLLREPIRNGYSRVCPTSPTGRWILHLGAVTFDGFNPRAVKPAPLDDPRLDGSSVVPAVRGAR